MKLEQWKQIVDDLKKRSHPRIYFTGGEPTLYKDFTPLFTRLEEIYQDDPYYIFDVLLFDYYSFSSNTLPRKIALSPLKGPKLSLKFNESNQNINID